MIKFWEWDPTEYVSLVMVVVLLFIGWFGLILYRQNIALQSSVNDLREDVDKQYIAEIKGVTDPNLQVTREVRLIGPESTYGNLITVVRLTKGTDVFLLNNKLRKVSFDRDDHLMLAVRVVEGPNDGLEGLVDVDATDYEDKNGNLTVKGQFLVQ